jgi:hypothetical protein
LTGCRSVTPEYDSSSPFARSGLQTRAPAHRPPAQRHRAKADAADRVAADVRRRTGPACPPSCPPTRPPKSRRRRKHHQRWMPWRKGGNRGPYPLQGQEGSRGARRDPWGARDGRPFCEALSRRPTGLSGGNSPSGGAARCNGLLLRVPDVPVVRRKFPGMLRE